MQRVYPARINWENEPSIATPINETNLNKIDYAVYEIDGRVVTQDTTKANQSDLLTTLSDVTYDETTGLFTFTWKNGTTRTVDLNIEKIPVSFSMSEQGVITMTTADGTQFTADVSSLIKTYSFSNSDTVGFTVTTDASGNKTVVANIVDGAITETKIEPTFLSEIETAIDGTQNSEAWAVGERGGVPVESTDVTYHNNSKYYSEQSSDSGFDSEAFANGTRNGIPVESDDPAYHNNSKYWSSQSAAQTLTGLQDTDIDNSTLADGDVIRYNSESEKWENESGLIGVEVNGTELILNGRVAVSSNSEKLYGDFEITNSNKNLNDYTTIGNYYKSNTTFICTNCPIEDSTVKFRLRVSRLYSTSTEVIQTIYDTNSSLLSATRFQIGGGAWSDWKTTELSSLPTGGTVGQILEKASALDYDLRWADKQTASGVPYDNTDSGLTASTTQGAVDEIVDMIGDVSTLLDAL